MNSRSGNVEWVERSEAHRLARYPLVGLTPFDPLHIIAVAFALLASVLATPAAAQKAPSLGYAFPPAITIGQTTEVQLGGFDFTPDMQWFVHDDRVALESLGPPGEHHVPPPPYWTGPRTSTPALPIPREVATHISVDENAPQGFVRWQVANANGSSPAAMLYLSRDREIVESRIADRPQRLDALPIAVSGRLGRLTEVDRYELVADRDGVVSVDLMARRLGSDFNGAIEVRDAEGKLLVDHADTLGIDGGVTFTAQKGHTYTLALHDTDFRGDRAYVYRLAFAYGPRKIAAEAGDVRPTSDVPVHVTRQLPPGEREHRHTWRVEKDEYWSIAAQSYAIGGRLDVAIEVLDADGKPVGENDDAGGTTDAALTFRAAATGDYTCIVRAMSSLVGSDEDIYRLQITRQPPDYALSVPQQINLPSGGRTELAVTATRSGGLAGAIGLAIEGLPAGVTVEGDPTIPADKNEVKLTLVAANDAAVVASAIQIRGAAELDGKQDDKQDDKQIARTATAAASGNLCPRTDEQRRTTQVLLAMTMTPPFELRLVDHERQRAVHRGTTYRAEFEIVRKNNFVGELQLEMAAQQARYRQGIRGGTVDVAANADRALYPCFMPEWLPTDLTRRMVVSGVAAVPDPQGHPRYLVQQASGRITMILEGALLKLSAAAGEPTLRAGETLDVPVVVARSSKLPLPVTVELVLPAELAESLRAEPLVLAPGTDRGMLRIAASDNASLQGDWPLTLRATALEENKWPVVSQTEITVRFQNRTTDESRTAKKIP